MKSKNINYLIEKNQYKNTKQNFRKKKLNLKDEVKLTTFGKFKLASSYFILIFWALVILIPVTLIITGSINVNNLNYLNFSKIVPGIDNFSKLFNTPGIYFGNWMLNSLLVSVFTMLITVAVVSLTGYAYSRFQFKGKKVSLILVMLIQMVPSIMALIAFYIINKLIISATGLFPYATLIIIYSGGAIAGNTFVLKGYLDSISSEIDDSAKIDGCYNFKTYLKIIIPLARPMLSIIALWSFIGPFGDVILPRILLNNPASYTLPVGLYSLLIPNSNEQIFQPLYAAGALITAIPIVAVFIYSQKHMISGLSAGGVKG